MICVYDLRFCIHAPIPLIAEKSVVGALQPVIRGVVGSSSDHMQV